MESDATECLRRRAPRWSLAGDAELLAALHSLHQRVARRCGEGEAALRALAAALRDAALALGNVNNQLQALSNTQFVESRVYDDDLAPAIAPATAPAIAPAIAQQPLDAAACVLPGLLALERCHERVSVLCGSDSDSGSEGGGGSREVLRARDRYAQRPLPHVVGSRGWRGKWHAGLLVEDSDSDSSASPARAGGGEQYSPSPSPSPPERAEWGAAAAESPAPAPALVAAAPAPAAAPAAAPALVAAALALRLGAHAQPPPAAPPAAEGPAAPRRALYAPTKPLPGVVFPDSPPPAPASASRSPSPASSGERSPPGDVFAELRRPRAGGIFSDVIDPGRKKPAGARPAFGAGVSAEHVAAALQRQLRAPQPAPQPAPRAAGGAHAQQPAPRAEHDTTAIKTEKDIFDDLFAKSDKSQNKKNTFDTEAPEREEEKVDLFSDNIFNDIDDIFSSNVVTKAPARGAAAERAESLFEDDGDLFSDVAVTATNKRATNTSDKVTKASIFDSDDELFSEKPPVITKSVNLTTKSGNTPVEVVKIKVNKEVGKVTTSDEHGDKAMALFDDDDSDIFKDKPSLAVKTSQSRQKDKTVNKNMQEKSVNKPKTTKSIFDDDEEEELFMEKTTDNREKIPQKQIEESTKLIDEKKSIFDDSDDDIFSNIKLPSPAQKVTEIQENKIEIVSSEINSQNPQVNKKQAVEENIDSTAGLFEDDVGLFADTKVSAISVTPKMNVSKQSDKTISNKDVLKPKHAVSSPNLFDDDDDIDNLFVNSISRNMKTSKTPENDDIFKSENFSTKGAATDKRTSNNISVKGKVAQVAPEATEHSETARSLVEPELENSIRIDTSLDQDILGTPVEKGEDRKLSQRKRVDDTLIANISEIDTNIKDDNISFDEDDALFASSNIAKTICVTNTTVTDESVLKPNIAHKADLLTSKRVSVEQIIEHKTEDDKNVIEESSGIFGNKSDNLIDKEAVIMNNKNKSSTEGDVKDVMEKNKDLHTTEIDSNRNITQLESNRPDLFSDVFDDLPPAFEKPKEPKKSKNINALFDDDSDDDTLFFKKNDVILDEKPEDFSLVGHKGVFGIFHDEPPAIDVEFLQKPSQGSGINDKLDIEEDISVDVAAKCEKMHNINTHEVSPRTVSDEDLFTSKTETKPPEVVFPRPVDKPDGVSPETKKIGKLKPMNFQINVNSLLPGASPKKMQRVHEQTDGQVVTKSNEELHTDTANDGETEYKLVKSVSFEGGPESPILDNKLSKERAKIQVKRRPSTRRARKAALNVGEDSTDNSSSIDDAAKVKVRSDYTAHMKDENVQEEKVLDKAFANKKTNYEDISAPTEKPENVHHEERKRSELNRELKEEGKNEQSSSKESPSKDITSKVVYVLNDEDIFSNKPVECPKPEERKASDTESVVQPTAAVKPKILKIVDDEGVCKTGATSSGQALAPAGSVQTLGRVYPGRGAAGRGAAGRGAAKPNIFDDDDDDDIFKDFAKVETTPKSNKQTERKTHQNEPKPVTIEIKPKPSLFDLSDEESELFGAKRDVTTSRSGVFGSDGGEGGLFANSRGARGGARGGGTEEAAAGAAATGAAARAAPPGAKKEARRVRVTATLLADDDDAQCARGLDPLSALAADAP